MMRIAAALSPLLASAPPPASAFVAPRGAAPRAAIALRATAAEASAALEESQRLSLANIRSAVPELAEKPDASWYPQDGVTIAGMPAVLEAFDAPGPPNIAWLSALRVDGRLSSLTAFCGPLTDVPHLCSRCIITDSTLSLFLDWRPRAYGAYETRNPDGTYPGPDVLGRDYFTYSGARSDMEKFYSPELEAFVGIVAGSFERATPDPASELDALTRGPLAVSVTMPLTDANVGAVASARSAAADAWAGWVREGDAHAHRPGAPVNTQYVYDTKYRQNCYGALLETYGAAFGADAAKLTAAESGPLDEAYVGGGS